MSLWVTRIGGYSTAARSGVCVQQRAPGVSFHPERLYGVDVRGASRRDVAGEER
jgi:hypothetical protein